MAGKDEQRSGGTVFGVLAHVDAGKTTLSEQILFHAGRLRAPGRVDEQTAFLDHQEIERRRGITVFADQAELTLGGRPFTLIDTPGHVDFSGEMERCLSVLDCAVLVVSSVEGVQAHTQTVWELLRKQGVPTMVFLNKTDRAGADRQKVWGQLERLGAVCVDGPGLMGESGEAESAAEVLAGLDDGLLERFLSTGYDREIWLDVGNRLFAEGRICPVFAGSALQGEGIEPLLDGLRLLAPLPRGNPEAPFSGRVYKVRHEKGGRVVFLKVEQGTLHPKEVIAVPERGENGGAEKCNELRCYSGERFALLSGVGPGTLCAVTGVQTLRPGDRAGEGAAEGGCGVLRPLLSSRVLYADSIPARTMLARFRELEDEEPLLGVDWNERLQELSVHVMGEVQLEVLTELFRQRFGEEIRFGPCSVLYGETLAAPVVGCGHFEPLRHYAEVHLRLEPAPRGSGISFASQCQLDDLSSSWQNLVRTHVLEKQHLGVLTGSPLMDVTITLLSGRSHLKHTEGGDFREATYRAIRQGLMHAESLLLEPWYAFTAEVEFSELGRVQADVQRMGGTCEAPEEAGGRVRLRGRAPLAQMMDYPRALTAFTKGKGRISFLFDGYEPCREQDKIVEEWGYDPERDVENTPDSVFCSHGAGFPVKWREAPAYMHLPVEEP